VGGRTAVVASHRSHADDFATAIQFGSTVGGDSTA
jgi:hypothetical protein